MDEYLIEEDVSPEIDKDEQGNSDKYEYIIKGDTDEFDDCLVYVCGPSEETAKEALHRMLTNPTENDKSIMKGHRNFRIVKVPESTCWWNYNND